MTFIKRFLAAWLLSTVLGTGLELATVEEQKDRMAVAGSSFIASAIFCLISLLFYELLRPVLRLLPGGTHQIPKILAPTVAMGGVAYVLANFDPYDYDDDARESAKLAGTTALIATLTHHLLRPNR